MSARTKPRTILHVFGRMNRGGAEMRTVDIMMMLDRQHYALQFCALSGLRGELEPTIEDMGGATHHCRLNFLFPIAFFRLIRSSQIDVVHSHVHFSSGLILLLARLAGVQTRIAHFRTTGSVSQATVLAKLKNAVLRMLINRNATRILAVSEGAMSAAWGEHWIEDPRCQVIYNTVYLSPSAKDSLNSVREELGVPLDCMLVIHVGRMNPAKNHARVLDIFEQLLEREPHARLVLVGNRRDPIDSMIEQRLLTNSLQDKVLLLGERHDVQRLLAAADLLLFPSLWEGLPGAVLEASALGIPTVASDLPGVLEIAEYFPTVHPVSLSSDNNVWCQTCLAAISSRTSQKDARIVFEDSPFAPQTVVDQLVSTWDGQ